ncbi:hypothetical protein A2625_02940 [candidate division WOR-1 bacterium RIFCSPHIGHO2_01_FULL_53_15]|uniref:Alpha-D-phosphohexomutase alpha/beta/alpha domain-containing protein n=1 Tax=candidate division WOR-1 bacterium RIFCSPHIGHO2_01_FULL_53_15 TaxID=1802564 RepID=A0A1F4Q2I5_UNCSA|nr:MAG: hypothetical protein A2625_02940 [candidate division WOR-1 bacterium RIFCSPHIGHO2_01_FULL_53_15]OGC10385.1 MAG: hypothetical protein A3D23_07625 [candidate division WOR-1 bacterium RIFCSPHIGHO2_02_FULL_53_26]
MLKFGKDGWSAVISDEFTFANVRQVATAVAGYLIDRKLLDKPLIVGYDARFLSEKFAETAMKTLAETGISFLLTDRDVPLPVLAWAVGDRGAAGAFVVSAGGLPHQYSGIKFIPGHGQSALEYQSGLNLPGRGQAAKSKLERFDPRERYLKYAEASLDIDAINKAKPKIVVDPMFGSGRGYLDLLLQRAGCQVEEIHNWRDVLFGGLAPDPKEANLQELKAKVLGNKAQFGFALSGDGASFAVIDGQGKYSPGHESPDAILACAKIVEKTAAVL